MSIEQISNSILGNSQSNTGEFLFDPVFGIHRFLEYKRQNLWVIYHKDIPAWMVSAVDRPKISMGATKKIKYVNTYEKLSAGQGEWLPISLTFNDPIAPSASLFVYEQIKKQWDYASAKVGYKQDYVIKNLQIRELDPKGIVVQTWILHDAFFTSEVDFGVESLDYDAFKRLKVRCTIDYSWPELITGGTPQ